MATPIQNQGKIHYSKGQVGYIAKPYDFFTKGMLNGYYFSDSSEKSIDDWIINAANDPDRYKQVVKIELIYNETYPVTHFAEQVFTNMDTNYYLSRVSTYMPNLKEIKVGEGFGNFERGKCFTGLGNVEKIDLPSTFSSVGGIENGDYFMIDMVNLKTLILRNPIPPKFYDASGNEITPEDSFKRLGSAVVYVPDAAVETYKSNPVFADLDIRPLSSYQESDAKTVFLGKVKGKFELNGNKLGKFYINGVEYNTPDITGVKKNYIEFADSEVKRLCVQNFSSDGIGVTYDDAAAVTNLGGVFSANTAITSFDELQYFTGLQGIGKRAFDNCTSLTSVTIPNGVTTIGERAFAACLGLTSVTIPNGVTTIDSDAFDSCSNLTAITIPDSVTTIGGGAFTFCSNLTDITIPDSVTTIGGGAFSYCSRLASITIPNGVTTINNGTFSNCSITSITMPDSITFIGNYAFSNCSRLTSIDIPTGVTIISNSAFMNCSSLTSITIPTGITNIYGNAFSGCSSLTSITSLALTAPGITPSSFRDVSTGGTLYVPNGSTGYDVWMGTGNYYLGKYNWTLKKKYIEFKDPEVERICIENFSSDGIGVTYEDAASVTDLYLIFWRNTAITSFNELQYFTGLQEISENAFSGCSALTSVTIPDNVTSIGNNAIQSCSSLRSITIPSGVTSIGNQVLRNCSSLTSITSLALTAPTITNRTFQSLPTGGTLYIPANATGYDVWMKKGSWGTFYLGNYNWTLSSYTS